jgi:hypothetical protein
MLIHCVRQLDNGPTRKLRPRGTCHENNAVIPDGFERRFGSPVSHDEAPSVWLRPDREIPWQVFSQVSWPEVQNRAWRRCWQFTCTVRPVSSDDETRRVWAPCARNTRRDTGNYART